MLQHADEDLIRRESQMPALRLLLDEQAISARLRESFPQLNLGDVRATYVRYKPRTSALVGFRIDGAQPVMFHAQTFTPAGLEKLERDAPPEGAANPFGVAQLIWPEEQIVLRFFPHDRKLASLALLNQPARLAELLGKINPEHSAGGSLSMTTLAYKPERRYVARVDEGARPSALLKICTPDAYDLILQNARMFRSHGALRTPKLLGKSEWQQAVGLKFLPGRTLGQILADGAELDQDTIDLIARALSTLHQRYPEHPRKVDSNERTPSLLALGEMITWICPGTFELVESLLNRLVDPPQPSRMCAIHGDFYANQILIDDRKTDRAGILDFDEARLGNPWEDVANFLAHLESDAIRARISSERVARISHMWVSAYAGQARERSPELEFYLAISLFRLAPHPFRRREPDWDLRTRRILERAHGILHGEAGLP